MIILGLAVFATFSGCGATVAIPVHMVVPGTYLIPATASDTNNNTKTAQLTLVITP